MDLRYLTDSYDEKIKRINKFNSPLNFIFITDLHNRFNELLSKTEEKSLGKPFEIAVNAINSLQYIIDRCPNISFIVCGGDSGNDYDPDTKRYKESMYEVYDALYSLSVPVHCCVGNHDDSMGNCLDNGWDTLTHTILPEEMHEICMKYNKTKENYYYFDDSKLPYRYVFLNTSDRPYPINKETGQYEFGWRIEISEKQANWFENEAIKTDRKVIVFSHTPLSNKNVMGSEGEPLGIKPYEDLLGGSRVYNAVKEAKNVIMSIFGHVHFDNLIYDDSLLRISTQCGFALPWCRGCPDRIVGTPSEVAFDVFSVDGTLLNITRFGAGYDRRAHILRG